MRPRGQKQRKFNDMFSHIFCLCPLDLTINLNINISKAAYSFDFSQSVRTNIYKYLAHVLEVSFCLWDCCSCNKDIKPRKDAHGLWNEVKTCRYANNNTIFEFDRDVYFYFLNSQNLGLSFGPNFPSVGEGRGWVGYVSILILSIFVF